MNHQIQSKYSPPYSIVNSTSNPIVRVPFAILDKTIFADRRLTKTDIRVLGVLGTYRNNRSGVAYPAVGTISHDTGVDPRHVQRSLRRLQNLGYIVPTGKIYGRQVIEYQVHTTNRGGQPPHLSNFNKSGVADSAHDIRRILPPKPTSRNKPNETTTTQSPHDLAESFDDVVVVFSPAGETATVSTRPIMLPTVAIHNSGTDRPPGQRFTSDREYPQNNPVTTDTVAHGATVAAQVQPGATSIQDLAKRKTEINSILSQLNPIVTNERATTVLAVKGSTTGPMVSPTKFSNFVPDINSSGVRPSAGIVNGRTEPVALATTQPVVPWHHTLSMAEANIIDQLLSDLPSEKAATVKTELFARFDVTDVRSPVGYARKLIATAQAGEFIPAASRETIKREEYAAMQTAQEQVKAEEEDAKEIAGVERTTNLADIRSQIGKSGLKNLREEFLAGMDYPSRKFHLALPDGAFNAAFNVFLLKQCPLPAL